MQSLYGKYLDVDLSSRTIREYAVPEAWQRVHVGGRGVAARILLEELPQQVDPFGLENILVFATGPFQGTGMVGAGRHAVLGVSPKTGRVADSYAGGFFGHELARTGYDGILIRGLSETPVVLALVDGEATIEAADDLWGRGTGEVDGALRSRVPKSHVCSIGVAGENLVHQACIISDRSRSAGRPGLGAVMGAKRLKAIVVRGDREKTLHDPERFTRERAAYAAANLHEGAKQFGEYGTAGGVTWLSEQGILPTKNFQEGTFDEAEAIGGVRMHDTILVGRETCAGCPIRCKRVVETTFEGRSVRREFGGPEYETVAAFGSLCLNADLDAIAMANQLCNDLGVDTISAGVTIAFLMEASEKGRIDEAIPWGDGSAIVRLVGEIARREGIGGRVADGLVPFAEEMGADYAMAIKGVEIPMHEPRGKQGLGLSYATAPRGATHMEGMHDTALAGDCPSPEIGVTHAYDRFSLDDKAEVAVTFEHLRSFDNSLVLCCFTTNSTGERYNYGQIRSLLEAATGLTVDATEMLRIGERNMALMRLLSGRLGHRMAEDTLPTRFFEPLPRGGSAGHAVDAQSLKKAIAQMYRLRGYDEYGPTDETLARLGMSECVGALEREQTPR